MNCKRNVAFRSSFRGAGQGPADPNQPREELLWNWPTDKEKLAWEVERDEERMTEDPLVLYPELIYRRWRDEELIEETTLPIPIRCFYPDEILNLIYSAGFAITGTPSGSDLDSLDSQAMAPHQSLH